MGTGGFATALKQKGQAFLLLTKVKIWTGNVFPVHIFANGLPAVFDLLSGLILIYNFISCDMEFLEMVRKLQAWIAQSVSLSL